MKKKSIFVSLIVATSIFSLASCKKQESNNNEKPNPEQETITYTVTFVTNCEKLIEGKTVNQGDKVSKPEIVNEGYKLDGWYVDSNFEIPYNFDIEVSSNLTLYAKWSLVENPETPDNPNTPDTPEVTKYTITFDLDGGEGDFASYEVDENATISKPTSNPTKSGYVFKGWVDSNGNEFNFDTPITSNTTIKAKYNQLFTVTFVDGEEVLQTETIENGNKVNVVEGPSKVGYIFAGWVDSDGNEFNFDSPITSNTTIKAKYVIDRYYVLANGENVLYKNDFNDNTETFEEFESWGHKGLYSYKNIKKNEISYDDPSNKNELNIDNGKLKLVDTTDNGTQAYISFEDEILSGVVEGVTKLSLANSGGSYSFFQIYGTSDVKTEASEIFGLTTDRIKNAELLKYRLNGSNDSLYNSDNNLQLKFADNVDYELYFKIDLDNNTFYLTISVDNEVKFIIDTTNTTTKFNFKSICGLKFLSSDTDSKTCSVDFVAVKGNLPSLSDYKSKYSTKVNSLYATYDLTKYTLNENQLANIKDNALNTILNAETKNAVVEAFNTCKEALSEVLNDEQVAFNKLKTDSKNELDSYIKSKISNLTEDKDSVLLDKISTLKDNAFSEIDKAKTEEEITTKVDETKINLEKLLAYDELDKFTVVKKAELNEDDSNNKNLIDQSLSDAKTRIDSALTIDLINSIVNETKANISEIVSNASKPISEVRTESIVELEGYAQDSTKDLHEDENSKSTKEKIELIVNNFKAGVENLETSAEVTEALATAKSNIEACITELNSLDIEISYVTNYDEKSLPTSSVKYGIAFKEPSTLTADDAILIGWYYDAELTNEFDPNENVYENLTLYAKWHDVEKNITNDYILYDNWNNMTNKNEFVEISASKLGTLTDKNGVAEDNMVFEKAFLPAGSGNILTIKAAYSMKLVLYFSIGDGSWKDQNANLQLDGKEVTSYSSNNKCPGSNPVMFTFDVNANQEYKISASKSRLIFWGLKYEKISTTEYTGLDTSSVKTEYIVGNNLDLSNIKLNVKDGDAIGCNTEDLTCKIYDSNNKLVENLSAAGNYKVIVKYGKYTTATYEITVSNQE